MKNIFFAFIAIACCAFTSNAQNLDANLRETARSLAISLKKKEVRDFVKAEATKQFDKDYEFLIKTTQNSRLANARTLNETMKTEAASDLDLTAFSNANPRVQISVPIKCEEWNTAAYTPLVAYIPSTFNDKRDKEVEAFDGNGRSVRVGVNDDSKTLIVVSLNERTNAQGQVLPQYDNNATNSTNKVSTCYGADGDWEILTYAKVSNIGAIEPLVLGKPEIDFIAKKLDGTDLLGGFGTRIGLNRKNQWQTVNGNLFRWYKSSVGDAFVAYFVERDGGAVKSIPVTVAVVTPAGTSVTVNVDVPVGNDDDTIGVTPIYFIDCSNQEYNIGGILQIKLKR